MGTLSELNRSNAACPMGIGFARAERESVVERMGRSVGSSDGALDASNSDPMGLRFSCLRLREWATHLRRQRRGERQRSPGMEFGWAAGFRGILHGGQEVSGTAIGVAARKRIAGIVRTRAIQPTLHLGQRAAVSMIVA